MNNNDKIRPGITPAINNFVIDSLIERIKKKNATFKKLNLQMKKNKFVKACAIGLDSYEKYNHLKYIKYNLFRYIYFDSLYI